MKADSGPAEILFVGAVNVTGDGYFIQRQAERPPGLPPVPGKLTGSCAIDRYGWSARYYIAGRTWLE